MSDEWGTMNAGRDRIGAPVESRGTISLTSPN